MQNLRKSSICILEALGSSCVARKRTCGSALENALRIGHVGVGLLAIMYTIEITSTRRCQSGRTRMQLLKVSCIARLITDAMSTVDHAAFKTFELDVFWLVR